MAPERIQNKINLILILFMIGVSGPSRIRGRTGCSTACRSSEATACRPVASDLLSLSVVYSSQAQYDANS